MLPLIGVSFAGDSGPVGADLCRIDDTDAKIDRVEQVMSPYVQALT